MKVKINGVEVRIENLGEEVEMKFENLSEEAQKKVFLDNKDAFFINAIKSSYKSVGDLAIRNIKECSKNTVDETVKELDEGEDLNLKHMDRILEILNSSDEQISVSTLERLAFSKYWSIRNWIAWRGKVSLPTLIKMFIEALNQPLNSEDKIKYLNHIIKNPNFKITESLAKKLRYEE